MTSMLNRELDRTFILKTLKAAGILHNRKTIKGRELMEHGSSVLLICEKQ